MMKSMSFISEPDEALQKQIMQIQSRYVIGNPCLSRFCLQDLYDPLNLEQQNRLYTPLKHIVSHEMSYQVLAIDLFIQKLRSIYLSMLVFSRSPGEKCGQPMQNNAAKIFKNTLHKMLKCFYIQIYRDSAASKYMADFLQLIQIQLFSSNHPSKVIPELLTKYPKMDQFFIDILMYKIRKAQQTQQIIDQNYTIAVIMKMEFQIECLFITDREFILDDYRVSVTKDSINVISNSSSLISMMIEDGNHNREWLDVSKVKNFNENVFEEMDKSYIKDLSCISVSRGDIDKSKTSMYSSCHFSQLFQAEADEQAIKKSINEATMKKIQSFFEINSIKTLNEVKKEKIYTLFEGDSIATIDIEEKQEEGQSEKSALDRNQEALLEEIDSFQKSTSSDLKIYHSNKKRKESHENETNEGDLQELRKEVEKDFKFMALNNRQSTKCEEDEEANWFKNVSKIPQKLRKSVSQSSFGINAAAQIQQRQKSNTAIQEPPKITIRSPIVKAPNIISFNCKVKTNLTIRNKLVDANILQPRNQALFSSIDNNEAMLNGRRRINPLNTQYSVVGRVTNE